MTTTERLDALEALAEDMEGQLTDLYAKLEGLAGQVKDLPPLAPLDAQLNATARQTAEAHACIGRLDAKLCCIVDTVHDLAGRLTTSDHDLDATIARLEDEFRAAVTRIDERFGTHVAFGG